MLRWLGFVLLLCLCAAPIAPLSGAWAIAARGLDRASQAERAAASQAAPDEGTQDGTKDTNGTPPSSGTTADDADDLVPEQDPAEPAPVLVTVVRTLPVPSIDLQGLGPADGHGRGTDHPPRS